MIEVGEIAAEAIGTEYEGKTALVLVVPTNVYLGPESTAADDIVEAIQDALRVKKEEVR